MARSQLQEMLQMPHAAAVPPLAAVVRTLLSDACDPARAEVRGQRVLVRVDFNVPLSGNEVTDWSRVEGACPTLRLLLANGGRVVIMSHLGRPQPAQQTLEQMRAQFSLRPVVDRLAAQFGSAFRGLADDCIGAAVEAQVDALQDGQLLLLENTRFHPGDVGSCPAFAAALGRLADVFVNDAFGVCHRDQGSVTGVAATVPRAFPGLLVRDELRYLFATLDQPQRPFACVVGGAKVADKIGVLWSLLATAQVVLVGGRMAYTFLASRGVQVGSTLIEHDCLEEAAALLVRAEELGVRLVLPVDCIGTKDLNSPQPCCIRPLTPTCCTRDRPCIPAGFYGADIGPASCELFTRELKACKTVFWNGPMGRFEVRLRGLMQALHAGGDSAAAINQMGLSASYTHVSTGGGASLELIEGRGMPGLRALCA